MPGSYRIRVHGLFESAHYLYRYFADGQNEPLHGHSFEAELLIDSQQLENGISVDFIDVRREFDQLLARLDHICLNELEPFTSENPTAENLAIYIYRQLAGFVPAGAWVAEVRVWEGPRHYASYFPPRIGLTP